MKVKRDFSNLGEKPGVFLTIGFFDGVHLGHTRIIKEVVEKAKANNLQSLVITFDCHPTEFFSGRKVRLLTSWEEKEEIFRLLGVDLVQVFTFDSKFADLSPEEFLRKLIEIFDITGIIVGEEFTFGKNKKGDVKFLHQKQFQFGYRLEAIPCVKLNGEKISSSLLRRWLKEGEIGKVTQGLGRYPTIIGKVIAGKGRGREIGCPTANLEPHPRKLLPANGVYAGYVELEEKEHKALINIGEKPTFGDFTPGVEVHVINFTGVLYEKMLKIDLVKRIRDIRPFSSPLHLSRQLEKDKEKVEKILAGHPLLKDFWIYYAKHSRV